MSEEKVDALDTSPANGDSNGVATALSSYVKPQHRKPHDPTVLFEEYHYYAKRTREEERNVQSPRLNWREVLLRKKNEADVEPPTFDPDQAHLSESHRLEITDEEWTNASRAFRTASWGACKYSRRIMQIELKLKYRRLLLDHDGYSWALWHRLFSGHAGLGPR